MPKKQLLTPVSISLAIAVYLYLLNFVSNDSYESNYLAILPALIFSFIILLSGVLHKYIFKLLIVTNILIASITIFFKWRYKATVTEDILLSGMMNDTSLTAEMLSVPLLLWLIFTALIPILIIIKIDMQRIAAKRYLLSLVVVILLIIVTLVVQEYEYRAKGQIRDHKSVQAIGSFSPLDVFYAYKKALKAQKTLTQDYLKVKSISHAYQSQELDEDRLIVLIVGETSRGDHLSINGYTRETTPKLEKIKNLYSFSNAQSCDTLTLRSMHYMFSPLRCDNDDSRVTEESFTKILSSLGYHIEIYSLQTLNAFYHYLGYDKLISKYAVVREQESGTKDKSLLPYIEKSIHEYRGGKRLIIVHTLGSHQSYFDRIDKSSEQFVPACKSADVAMCDKDELVNAYDNTILAVDDFISSIIGMLSHKRAMLIYTSDHGESLGEGGYYLHGKPKKTAPPEQFVVPFLFWFSDSYTKTKEAKSFAKQINRTSLDMNISHDYLFHSILGCSGVVSEDGGIDGTLDLCNENISSDGL